MTFSSRGFRFILCVFALALFQLSPAESRAQISALSGAINGTVVDPSGASVSGAKVTLTSPLGATLTKESGADGSFTFPLLDPGIYRLTVEFAGFRRTVLEKVAVRITEVAIVTVKLELGEVTTEVVVAGEAAQLVNTTNATLGKVLPGDVIENMPLPTRNFIGLLALNAGTSASLPNAAAAGRGPYGSTSIFVAGQRGTFNNLVINGIDSNNLGNNNFGAVAIPAPDTIEEFRVQTNLYDASQGKTSGGNINVITKSGTDKYHGEAYEFFRNDDLNANFFFFNKNGSPRPVLKQNQFGGNFGGPVPAIAKTFFFGSYEGTRQRNGVSSAISAQWPVIPASRSRADIESAFGLAPGTLDSVALAVLNLPGQFGGFLFPTGAGAAPGKFGIATVSKPLQFRDDQFNTNVDHLIGDKHRLSAKFFFANSTTNNPLGGQDSPPPGFGPGDTAPNDNRLAALSWTYTVTPNVLNEAHFGFNRIVTARNGRDPAKVSGIGMTRFNSSVFPGIPVLSTDDLGPEFGGISTNFDQAAASNTFHFADTLAYTHGSHTFRGGFEYRRYQINLFNNFASRGFLQFGSFQDFLLGKIELAFVGTGQTDRGFRARDMSFFFQDDWKVTRRLTLNLGVRYDYLGPSTDVKDRLGNFDPSLLDSATRANAGAGLLNGFVLPASANFGAIKGTPGVDRSTLTNVDHNDVAPRVGFAWDVFGNGKTAVRGGYGLYYVRISNQTLLQLITAAPFFQLSSVLSPGTPMSNPWPTLPLPAAFPIFPTPPTFQGFNSAGSPMFSGPLLSLNPFERGLQTPYAQQWNFTIQRELPMHFTMELGYIGSEGVRLLHGRQMNQARLANPANPIVVGGAASVPVTTITADASRNNNARVGVLGFSTTGLNMVTGNGHAVYHAMILTVTRRTANMFLQGAYTFSKSIDNYSGNTAGTQDLGNSNGNQVDTTVDRGLSNFDRTHRLQVTYRYAIPWFKTGALRHVLGNWEFGGLTTFQSGLPNTFTCTSVCANNLFGQRTSTFFPVVVGDLNNLKKPGSPQDFTNVSVFNTGIIAPPPTLPTGTTFGPLNVNGGPGDQTFTIGGPGTGSRVGALFGNLGRNIGKARDPGQQQWDFYVAKSFPIGERTRLQFRSEFFNVFNHPNFVITNTAIGASNFGVYDTTTGSPRIIQFALKLLF